MVSCVAICAGYAVSVDVEGGGRFGVAESLRDGDDGDAVGEHLGGHELPRVVQPELADSGAAAVIDESLHAGVVDGHAVGAGVLAARSTGAEGLSTLARLNPTAEWVKSMSADLKPSIWLRRAPVEAAHHQ